MPVLEAPPLGPRVISGPEQFPVCEAARATPVAAPDASTPSPYNGDWIAMMLWLSGAGVICAMLIKDLVVGLFRL